MRVEVYRDQKKQLPDEKKELQTAVAEANKLKERYLKLGFRVQARMIDIAIKSGSPLVTDKIQPGLFYPRITVDDLKVWFLWLPTHYLSDQPDNYWGSFAQYKFDQIPPEVLTELELSKALRLFHRYEIRTPEKKSPDPILIGWHNDVPYLLVRWGESLRPFEEIKKEVSAKRIVP